MEEERLYNTINSIMLTHTIYELVHVYIYIYTLSTSAAAMNTDQSG